MEDISKHFILFYIFCFLSGICCLTTIFIILKENHNEFIRKLRDLIVSFFLFVVACFIEFYRIYFFSKWEMNVLVMSLQDLFIIAFLIAWVRLITQVTDNGQIKKVWFLVPVAGIIDLISWFVVYVFYMDKEYNVTSISADQWLLVTDSVLYILILIYNLFFIFHLLKSGYEKRKRNYLITINVLITIVFAVAYFDTLCYYFRPEVFELTTQLYPFHPLFLCFFVICISTVVYLYKENLSGLTEPCEIQSQILQYSFDEVSEKFNLTRREKELVELVFKGLSNPEISRTLNISTSTVKRHIQNIFKKMNIKNRFELIYMIRTDQE